MSELSSSVLWPLVNKGSFTWAQLTTRQRTIAVKTGFMYSRPRSCYLDASFTRLGDLMTPDGKGLVPLFVGPYGLTTTD
jgi:hypothetical protein